MKVIAPVACALRLDSPPPLGLGSCKTRLTLEQVMSPAEAIATITSTGGVDGEGEDETASTVYEGGSGGGDPAFFDVRNITLGSLAEVAEEATPILVTTATTLTLTVFESGGGGGGNVTDSSEHDIPLGSVIGIISEDDFAALEASGDIEETLAVDPFADLLAGATYGIPAGAVITSNVTSIFTNGGRSGASATAGGVTAVTVGGNDRVVVTIPNLNNTALIPWTASLVPVPHIDEANYDDDATNQLPIVLVTNQASGVITLIPLSDDTPAEEIQGQITVAEGGAMITRGGSGGGGLIYGTSDETGLGDVVPSSTTSCLFAVIIAEASCIPMLESVSEVFELDMGWRVCCARIAAVDDDRCFCDGAVAAALDINARSVIHERIMDAVPAACDFTAGAQRTASSPNPGARRPPPPCLYLRIDLWFPLVCQYTLSLLPYMYAPVLS